MADSMHVSWARPAPNTGRRRCYSSGITNSIAEAPGGFGQDSGSLEQLRIAGDVPGTDGEDSECRECGARIGQSARVLRDEGHAQ